MSGWSGVYRTVPALTPRWRAYLCRLLLLLLLLSVEALRGHVVAAVETARLFLLATTLYLVLDGVFVEVVLLLVIVAALLVKEVVRQGVIAVVVRVNLRKNTRCRRNATVFMAADTPTAVTALCDMTDVNSMRRSGVCDLLS